MLSPQISAPPRRGSSDPPPPTHGPRAVPSVLSRRPPCEAGLGVGQLGPSRGPEQKQLSDFYSAQHGTGKCLGGWITGPRPNQGSPKIPKAAADTASEAVWDFWAFATQRRSAGESLGQSPREGSFCVCCAGANEASQGRRDQCPVLTLSVPGHCLAPNLPAIGESFSQFLPVPSQTEKIKYSPTTLLANSATQ